MASPSTAKPSAAMVTLRIVHGAMILTILMYGVIAFVVQGSSSQPLEGEDALVVEATVERNEPPPALTYVLAGVGLVCLIAAIVVRRSAVKSSSRPDLFEQDAAETKAKATPAGLYFTRSIIAWALCEAVAIFGLVLAMVHRDGNYYLPFASAALIGMILVAPKKHHLATASPPK